MAGNKKTKRKKPLVKSNRGKDNHARLRRAYHFFDKGLKHWDNGKQQQALSCLLKAAKERPPEPEDILRALIDLGEEMKKNEIIIKGYNELERAGLFNIQDYPDYINALLEAGKFKSASEILLSFKNDIKQAGYSGKGLKKQLKEIERIESYCRQWIEYNKFNKNALAQRRNIQNTPLAQQSSPASPKPEPCTTPVDDSPIPIEDPEPAAIPVTIQIDRPSFTQALESGKTVALETLDVTVEAHRINFRNSFENLLCLPLLHNVESFWYQEETARKVVKTFRGRAMLADEVGLGKTVEACMVLREYIQRGMVKNALILTPTPLVSQWQEELRSKFDLEFVSTDDQGSRIDRQFWQHPFILSSINKAKSKINFEKVTGREYDMVIVDEAHHLKNKNTLNWKLVNSLKKRFLLFLTATPVENNLMELYNLTTLLKPGLLSTAQAFKREFVSQGDTVSPAKRARLRSLLDQVMIRNTRALAALNIPPRFAQTVRVEPQDYELQLYQTLTDLVRDINACDGRSNRILLKSLLAESGSSPRALSGTLENLLVRDDGRLDVFSDRIRAVQNMCRSITGETGKNRALLQLLKKQAGKKIVFVKFIGSMEEIAEYLEWNSISYATFHGSMNNRKKDEAIDLFRKEKDVLITTEIGGEGRNLQFCHQMINYDLPWNPMKIEQRIGRIHRIGQTKEVMIYNFCGQGSMEEHILEILDRKINMFEMVIGEIDMILGRIRGEKDFEDMVFDIWVNGDSEELRRQELAKLGTKIKRSKTQYAKTRELDEQLFGDDYEL